MKTLGGTLSYNHSEPQQVLDFALLAWSIHGEICHVKDISDKDPGFFALLLAARSRQFEFILDEKMNENSWTTLSRWPRLNAYKFRALVPRSSLNRAREHLYQSNFVLQSWWIKQEQVFFGTVEEV